MVLQLGRNQVMITTVMIVAQGCPGLKFARTVWFKGNNPVPSIKELSCTMLTDPVMVDPV